MGEFKLTNRERNLVKKYVQVTDKILDFGTGTGNMAIALAKEGYINITGVDIAENMIKTAQEVVKTLGFPIHFLVTDSLKLPFNAESFDTIVASHVIMTIPGSDNRQIILKELHRILKPSGKLIFSSFVQEHNEEKQIFWQEEREKWSQGKQDVKLLEYGDILPITKDGVETYIHIPTEQEVKGLILTSGFRFQEMSQYTIEVDPKANAFQKGTYWIAKK